MPVPDFSPGEVLTAAAMDSIGLWLVTTASWTGSNTVTISNCFSSTYDAYRIMVVSGTSASSGDISMTLGPSSSSNYAHQLVFGAYANTPQASGSTGNASWPVAGGSGAGTIVVNADVFAPNLAQWSAIGATTATPTGAGYFAGNFRANTVFTNFTLTAGSTVTGATVRVYGYRK
jgi:hypothetical protein